MDDTTVPRPRKPNPALGRLERLIGRWEMKGRTFDSSHDNVSGKVTVEWFPGGFFMVQRGEITAGGLEVHGLEMIGYDPSSRVFPAYVYSSIEASPSRYYWDVRGGLVRHWTRGARYTGRFSEDSRTLSGGWRPAGRERRTPGNTYDVVMTRV